MMASPLAAASEEEKTMTQNWSKLHKEGDKVGKKKICQETK